MEWFPSSSGKGNNKKKQKDAHLNLFIDENKQTVFTFVLVFFVFGGALNAENKCQA